MHEAVQVALLLAAAISPLVITQFARQATGGLKVFLLALWVPVVCIAAGYVVYVKTETALIKSGGWNLALIIAILIHAVAIEEAFRSQFQATQKQSVTLPQDEANDTGA